MKYLVAVLLCWTGAQAAPPPRENPPPSRPPMDLREALEQYHPGSGGAPRRLSPPERAELRRQLSEFGQPANPAGARAPYERMPAQRRR
jgi:hypothetical protein